MKSRKGYQSIKRLMQNIAGAGRTTETVKSNADAIAQLSQLITGLTNNGVDTTARENITDLAGADRTTETVKGNADAIISLVSSLTYIFNKFSSEKINVMHPPAGYAAMKGGLANADADSEAFAALLTIGRPLFFPGGSSSALSYYLPKTIIPKNVVLFGESRDNTVLVLRNGQNGDFISISNDNSGLVDIQINGNYWNQSAGSGVLLADSNNNPRLERIKVVYCKEHGIEVPQYAWVYNPKDIIVERCMGWGVYNASSDNRWDDIYCNACHLGGIYEGGANNIWQNIKSITNGIYDGAAKNPGAVGVQVSGSGRSHFIGLDLQENAGHGLYIKDSERNLFTSVVCDSNGCDYSNGFVKPTVLRGDAVFIENGDKISIIGLDAENRNTGTKQSQRRAYTIDANCNSVKMLITADHQNNETAVDNGVNTILL